MGWALITGASGDLGAVIAQRLASEGSNIVVHTFRRITVAEELAERIRATGREAVVLKAHLGGDGSVRKFAETVQDAVGPVEVVVAAAASGVMLPMGQLSEHHLKWTMNATAFPLVGLAQTLRPRSIVALSSPGSYRTVPGYGALGAAKAALEAFVRYLAVEMAPHTQVNALSVGLVDTRSARLLPQWEEVLADVLENTPMGRLVSPQDVAEAVSWLVSPPSAMITGSTVTLDGGRGLHL